MLIGEDLLLMCLQVESGLPFAGLEKVPSPTFLSACLLAELAVQKQIGWTPRGVHVVDDLPNFHPLIDETLRAIKPRGLQPTPAMIAATRSGVAQVVQRHFASLVDRGLLHPGSSKRYWLFGQRRFPVRSTRARNEALAHLREAAIGERTSMRSVAMLMLANSIGATDRLLEEAEHNEAQARATSLSEEIRAELPSAADWDDNASAIAMLVSISESLPRML
jgi:hypothetical protein